MIKQFELSNSAFITDPCYARGTWCHGVVKTLPGAWNAIVDRSDECMWGNRVATLLAWHSSKTEDAAIIANQKLPFEVGVDSGQAGIFCDTIYPQNKAEQGKYGDLETFYGRACEATCDGSDFGTVDGRGVCSSSGYGDGGYEAFGLFEGDECVAIRIEFITPDEMEEEDEDEDDI